MLGLLETFFQQFGYFAVFWVLVLCGFGIPIPEDVTLVAGGVISGLGYTNVHIMFAVGMAGVLARFLPGLRSPIFLTAGMSGRISFWQWLQMDGFAALISVPLWIYLGSIGAENKDWLMLQVHRFQHGLFAVLGVAAVFLIWHFWRKRGQLLERKRALLEKRRQRKEKRRQK